MNIVILHNAVAADAPDDERDVLVQADAVASAVRRLGHSVSIVPVTLDLESLRRRLDQNRPDVVFNLVESLGGIDRLIATVPAMLDGLGIPYTGARTEAQFLTSHKLLAKEFLKAHGLPTPAWWTVSDSIGRPANSVGFPIRVICKPVHEHGSLGMDEQCVLTASSDQEIRKALRERTDRYRRAMYSEAFIGGREFNLSVLGSGGSGRVLPPAEIDFSAFPQDKLRIVGYRAKWDANSFEYHHTPRRFDFGVGDRALLERLTDLAEACWSVFELRGWARVDFRVDAENRPWILEVNTNPCIAPDAGFAAAVAAAGLTYDDAICAILTDLES